MRKILILLTVSLVVFVAVYRQRLYLRDPLAAVMRDGVKVNGVATMINYNNDVLLEDGSAGKRRLYLVQNWNKVAEAPTVPLKCFEGLACMADADQATGQAIAAGTRGRRASFEGVTMTNRRVEFVDEDGALVLVTLR